MMTYTSNIGKTLMLDLLDLAQVENSTFKLNKDNFSLIQVIQNSFEVVSHAASMKNIALIGPELNEEHETYFNQVYGD